MIISGTSAGSAAARAFAGQQPAAQNATTEPAGLLGLFSALLGNAGITPPAEGTPPAPTGDTELDLPALFRLGLQGSFSSETDEDPEAADAVAAMIDAPVQPLIPVDPKPMVNFVEALTALKTSLDRGEPLDPELLEQLESALTDLAEALGLKLEKLPVPEDFAALVETTGTDGGGLAGTLTQLLAPLATSLAAAQPASDADAIAQLPAVNAQLKALGDKLAAVLAALEDGQVPPGKLTAIGMQQGQPLDPEIEAALARFAAADAALAPAVPEEPVLATPALKLTEPVLTGKPAEMASAPDTADAPEPVKPVVNRTEQRELLGDQDQTNDTEQGPGQSMAERGRERAEPVTREPRAAFTAAPAATDASNNPAPSADASVQQPVNARVDASANPRIIQAGYQTSQQQLNLPQLAFELARQVQDGNTRFQIRLDPPELGRIDVRLDIDQSGQVNARLVVEKAETLDLMQRDQRGLERALHQAGLDSAKTNLEFSLKQNPFAGQQGQFDEGKGESGQAGGLSANDNGSGAGEVEETPPMVNLYRGALQASGVNIIA